MNQILQDNGLPVDTTATVDLLEKNHLIEILQLKINVIDVRVVLVSLSATLDGPWILFWFLKLMMTAVAADLASIFSEGP